MSESIKRILHHHLELSREISGSVSIQTGLLEQIRLCISAFNSGNKILFCGNGGSAADAQHIASELSGKFYLNRPPLYAEALHVNTSYLTATANDYGYAESFARLVEAKGRPGDILLGLSTSGRSENVLRALIQARKQKMITIGWTGENGGQMHDYCDFVLQVPSSDTPRIQEMHILLGHILCENIEQELFGKH